jgi:HAE1 family hydrophobic/amphiphilic exporter-1
VRGVQEVAGAITASTLTSVAVFAPIVFVHGIAGQIFGDQAVTVVSSLLVSLLVAIMFIPMLASRPVLAGGMLDDHSAEATVPSAPQRLLAGLSFSFARCIPSALLLIGRLGLLLFGATVRLVGALALAAFKLGGWLTAPLRYGFDLVWRAVERTYAVVIRGALRASWLVVLLCIGVFAAAIARVPALGVELLPEIRQGEFTLFTSLGVGSPLENTEQVMGELDRKIRAIEGVQVTALTVGVEKDTLTREIEGKHTARLTVRLEPEARAFEREEEILARARDIVAFHPAVRSIDVRRPTPFALDAPITVEILGRDLKRLEETAAEVVRRLEQIEALTDIRSSVRPGHPEARVTFDRDKTLEFGLDLNTVSNLVRDQVLGNVSTRFVEGDERIDVRVLGDEAILASLDDVLDLVVNPSSPTPVQLRSVAEVRRQQGPAEIRRIGNSRGVIVTAAGTGSDLGGLTQRIEDGLASLVTPEEVSVQLGGQKREMDQAQSSMRFALLLAMFLVYVVMACQFESLLQPLIILVTVPLAMVGVIFALDFLHLPVSVTVFIGMILLAGIVVNNAIVLVDRINQRRALGEELFEAVVEAGGTRLRPIMMTTATTVLGLLPLTGWLVGVPGLEILGSGEGAEIRAPMAICVVTGLATSTLLTLVVIPVVYYLVARVTRTSAARTA